MADIYRGRANGEFYCPVVKKIWEKSRLSEREHYNAKCVGFVTQSRKIMVKYQTHENNNTNN